jgi:hypothetical protein
MRVFASKASVERFAETFVSPVSPAHVKPTYTVRVLKVLSKMTLSEGAG